MADSTGQTTFDLGKFDNCNSTYNAHYCLLEVDAILFGVCVPESCGPDQIRANTGNIRSAWLNALIEVLPLLWQGSQEQLITCGRHRWGWDGGSYAVLALFLGLTAAVVFGTLVEMFGRQLVDCRCAALCDDRIAARPAGKDRSGSAPGPSASFRRGPRRRHADTLASDTGDQVPSLPGEYRGQGAGSSLGRAVSAESGWGAEWRRPSVAGPRFQRSSTVEAEFGSTVMLGDSADSPTVNRHASLQWQPSNPSALAPERSGKWGSSSAGVGSGTAPLGADNRRVSACAWRCGQLLERFSVLRNWRRLAATDTAQRRSQPANAESLAPLHGVRALSIVAVVIGNSLQSMRHLGFLNGWQVQHALSTWLLGLPPLAENATDILLFSSAVLVALPALRRLSRLRNAVVAAHTALHPDELADDDGAAGAGVARRLMRRHNSVGAEEASEEEEEEEEEEETSRGRLPCAGCGGLRCQLFGTACFVSGQVLLHRLARVLPVLLAILLAQWQLGPLVVPDGSPFWMEWNSYMDGCDSWWWSNLLFVNNFFPTSSTSQTQCLENGWLPAVEMQLAVVLLPVLLVAFVARPGYAMGLAMLLLLLSIATGAIIVHKFNLAVGPFIPSGTKPGESGGDGSGASVPYNDLYLYKPWTRAPPYLLGFVFATLWLYLERMAVLRRLNMRVRNSQAAVQAYIQDHVAPPPPRRFLSPCSASAIFAASLFIFAGVLYLGGARQGGNGWQPAVEFTYVTLGKPVFTVAVAGLTLVCMLGHGGPIRSFFSLPVWRPLARLTLAAFLLSPVVIRVIYYSRTGLFRFSGVELASSSASNLVWTYAAAAAAYVLVEGPSIGLEAVAASAMAAACAARRRRRRRRLRAQRHAQETGCLTGCFGGGGGGSDGGGASGNGSSSQLHDRLLDGDEPWGRDGSGRAGSGGSQHGVALPERASGATARPGEDEPNLTAGGLSALAASHSLLPNGSDGALRLGLGIGPSRVERMDSDAAFWADDDSRGGDQDSVGPARASRFGSLALNETLDASGSRDMFGRGSAGADLADTGFTGACGRSAEAVARLGRR